MRTRVPVLGSSAIVLPVTTMTKAADGVEGGWPGRLGLPRYEYDEGHHTSHRNGGGNVVAAVAIGCGDSNTDGGDDVGSNIRAAEPVPHVGDEEYGVDNEDDVGNDEDDADRDTPMAVVETHAVSCWTVVVDVLWMGLWSMVEKLLKLLLMLVGRRLAACFCRWCCCRSSPECHSIAWIASTWNPSARFLSTSTLRSHSISNARTTTSKTCPLPRQSLMNADFDVCVNGNVAVAACSCAAAC